MDELIEHVPEEFRDRFTVIAALTDGFCDAYLNDECKVLCREGDGGLHVPDGIAG